MKKVLSGMLIALVMIAFSFTTAYAGGHGGGSKCSKCTGEQKQCKVKKLKEKMSLYWAYKDELKLSEQQLQEIAHIKHEAMKQMIREGAEVKAIKVDVKTELWAPQIDVDKISPLIDAKYAAKATLAKTMVKALSEAQAILTEDQRQQMQEIKVDRYIAKSGILDSSGVKSCPHA